MAGAVPEVVDSDWIEVQEGQYRYVAIADGPTMVRIVVAGYIACEWSEQTYSPESPRKSHYPTGYRNQK